MVGMQILNFQPDPSPPLLRYMFYDGEKVVAEFWYDRDAEAWKFKGDADHAATVFVEHVLTGLEANHA